MESLPAPLANRVGQESGLPSREILSGYLSKQDLEWDFAAYLWQPLARARDNDPAAPTARYFVIHDTSGPSFGRRDFPADIDVSPKINNLANFQCQDGWGKAHVVISRTGGVLLDHEFAVPWRETKFERAVNFAGALKGLFIHIEMIQPRRSAGRSRHNDAQTPNPSFTSAQYDRLALIYIAASVRAGHWLVPAFHAALDANIRDGHDDPLNFNVESFAGSIDRMMVAMTRTRRAAPRSDVRARRTCRCGAGAGAAGFEKGYGRRFGGCRFRAGAGRRADGPVARGGDLIGRTCPRNRGGPRSSRIRDLAGRSRARRRHSTQPRRSYYSRRGRTRCRSPGRLGRTRKPCGRHIRPPGERSRHRHRSGDSGTGEHRRRGRRTPFVNRHRNRTGDEPAPAAGRPCQNGNAGATIRRGPAKQSRHRQRALIRSRRQGPRPT